MPPRRWRPRRPSAEDATWAAPRPVCRIARSGKASRAWLSMAFVGARRLLVGIDDARDQRVPHHIAAGELRNGNSRYGLQKLHGVTKPPALAARQIDRDGSPLMTALLPKPMRVRNIFICSGVV